MIKDLSDYKHLFILSGLAFMLGAYFWYVDIKLSVNAFSFTEGVVVDMEYSAFGRTDQARAVVHYSNPENGWDEIILPPTASIGLSEADSVQLMFPVGKPHSAIPYSRFDLWGGPVFVLGIGILVALAGVLYSVRTVKDEREILSLSEKSETLQTQFINVEKNQGAMVDGKMPYCIYSQWRHPKTAEIFFFKSQNLWSDPSDYIKGKKITVYVEPDDLKDYSVDLSFLPDNIIKQGPELSH